MSIATVPTDRLFYGGPRTLSLEALVPPEKRPRGREARSVWQRRRCLSPCRGINALEEVHSIDDWPRA